MPRLYIQPTPGNGKNYLLRIFRRLRYIGFTPTMVGYGYPPIYVNAPKVIHPKLKQIALEIDPNTIFTVYRPDLEGLNGMRLNSKGILESITPPLGISFLTRELRSIAS